MVTIGFHHSHEQVHPAGLLEAARRAQEVGFDAGMCSDHFAPWSARQGHSGFAWSWLGAALATTSLPFGVVNAPGQRYHPAIVAQAAATLAAMFPGRCWVALGSGENLNEHVVGGWPHVQQRHEMFEEALQIIRPLLNGETLTFSGNHFDVPDAYVWDRPDRPVPMAVAASGRQSATLAAEYADAMIATDPLSHLIDMYEEAGGAGRPRYGQVAICYGPDEDECRKIVHDQFRWFGLGWKVNADLPGPESFDAATQFVREEDVAEGISCGPDTDRHVEAFKKFVEAGFTHVALVQVGGDTQPMFLDWAQEELLPRLREL